MTSEEEDGGGDTGSTRSLARRPGSRISVTFLSSLSLGNFAACRPRPSADGRFSTQTVAKSRRMRGIAAAARDRGREQVHFDRPEAIPGDDVRLMATIIARCADKSPYLSPPRGLVCQCA